MWDAMNRLNKRMDFKCFLYFMTDDYSSDLRVCGYDNLFLNWQNKQHYAM